ncbi:MAG: galactose mutarotase [Eubacterium sp.]|nr:galactose mutarotase [Eubacterium sp.]
MYKESFGTSKQGEAVSVYLLENKNGASVRVTDYGAALVSIIVPDKNGGMQDVLLGYDNVTGYENNTCYFGAVIGRNGNRIANAQLTIDGVAYSLDSNDNENNLHSGEKGMDTIVWDVKEYMDNAITFTCKSADLEQGFPGNMDVQVTYVLTDEHAVEIHYEAVSDKDTVANFTNHAYFNLEGHASGNVLGQELMLRASYYTPVIDSKAIPTGEIAPVAGTPMDFTTAKTIGRDMEADDTQIKYGGGFDHNFVLDKEEKGAFELMAEAYAPGTGIVMEAYTDRPGVQFYSGNFITTQDGKQGAVYGKRQGFCLESQFFPNSVNEPKFEAPIIKAGEVYRSKTSYRFRVKK